MPNVGATAMTTDRAAAAPKQVSLFAVKWQPKKDQPLPWEIRQKLCKPKGGRNKKGDFDNFHNRDYDFVSPDGEIFTGKGVRRFAQEHGLSESALLDVLNGRVHSCKGWTKAVGGRKLPVPSTYYFLSPSGEIHTTTNLSEFARQHDLCPAMLSRISRCLKATHRGWRHCTPDGQPIVPSDRKHRKFTLLSPSGEIIEGSNLKAFAEQHSLSRGCLINVLDGTSREHKGWKLPLASTMTTTAPNLGKLFTSRTSRPATPEWKQWEKVECTSPVDTFLVGHPATQKERSQQDTNPFGRSNATLMPQPSTESDSQTPNLLSKTLPNLLTNLSEISTVSISLLGAAHARISALLENAPGLKELADNCFLNTSDVCKSSSLQLFVGSKFQQSYQVERGKTSSKSLMRLLLWGIWGLGKLETETATFPKTENDYSVWVFTGDIRATQPKTGKKSLQEIFNGESTAVLACSQDEQVANPKGVNSATGEEVDEAFTLTASTPKLGAGNKSHPNTFVSIPVKVYVDGVEAALESPALCAGGWQHRSPLHRDKRGASFAVLYRAASGDRLYHEECPTLRSLSNTGNHQSGSGAYKIREYQGESYLERPINATEAEQLMGWEVGSTAIGINKEGDEVTISQTQRIKMIGNGIIPAEITDILTAIKPMLERKLESEVPENMRFAYRQLRQRGMSHQDAMRCFPPQASLF